MSTLYEKIGGEKAVDAAVEIFYEKIMADTSLAKFFTSMDFEKQKRKQASFLTMAFGGPNKYTGLNMRAAHLRPVALGLNESHFNTVAGHLQDTLLELEVPSDLIQEVMTIVGTTKDDVLGL